VVSWIIELLFDRKPTTTQALGPILAMLSATIFTGHFDGQFTVVGYLLGFASCVTQAGAFEMGKRAAGGANKGVWSVLFANSVVGTAMQAVYLTSSGEIANLSPSSLTGNAVFHLAINSVSCILLNYAIYLNCTVNSPLAHAVTGNIKAALATLFGIFLLDKPLGHMAWAGIGCNFGGAAWFSWVKMRKNTAAAAAAPAGRQHRRAKSDDDSGDGGDRENPWEAQERGSSAYAIGIPGDEGGASGLSNRSVEKTPRSWTGKLGRRRVFAWA
jgi:hypothetical protein